MKRSTGFGIIVLAAAAVAYWQYPEQVKAYIPGLKPSVDATPSSAPAGGKPGETGGQAGPSAKGPGAPGGRVQVAAVADAVVLADPSPLALRPSTWLISPCSSSQPAT